LRNHLLSLLYNLRGRNFISQNHFNSSKRYKKIICIVAFNKVDVLRLCLKGLNENTLNFNIVVFDNSDLCYRGNVKSIVLEMGADYIELPYIKISHPNRSHSIALNWIYNNYILRKKPDFFGFIDHDLIAFKKINLEQKIDNIFCFGKPNFGLNNKWNLWAGYCFFNLRLINKFNVKLNFMYRFDLNLDTGGQNWNTLYRFLFNSQYRFCFQEMLLNNSNEQSVELQIIDHSWIHIGGASYVKNADEKLLNVLSFLKSQSKHYFF
jgi:hypothetical protein